MELSTLLQELKVRGAVIDVHADRLRVSPPTALTPDILDALRQHKPDIIRRHTARGNSSRFAETPVKHVESVTARTGIEVPIGPVPGWMDLEAIFRWLNAPYQRECPWCPLYRHGTAWRSVFGPHLICATCHPPARPDIVAEWIGEDVACR